jgi:hypothetical protein
MTRLGAAASRRFEAALEMDMPGATWSKGVLMKCRKRRRDPDGADINGWPVISSTEAVGLGEDDDHGTIT